MVEYNSLNERQKEAVLVDDRHVRVIAGAGSGKTRVLTMRIAYLIAERQVYPNSILAITFTNKAAKEMKDRIEKMIATDGGSVWISTIHSLCMRILREDIMALGYPRNFSIVDQNDQNQILKEAYRQYDIDKKTLPYGVVLNYIANNKYADIDPQRALMMAGGNQIEERKAKAYAYYCERLRSIYGLDFDDLILWTVELFKKYIDIKTKWAKRFRYVMVDEFQDIDKSQYELIRQLSFYHDNLYVVGDPDQTIYTWRGADVNIIINFEKDYPDTRTIILNQNYRSTNNILNGANSVIKNNRARVEKDLFAQNGDGAKIIHKSLDNDILEAYYVKNTIQKIHDDGTPYRDIAVLYRSNYLSRNIEKVLVENGIPYVIYGGIRFYERAEVKDILSYLKLITLGDDLSFIRVINTPKRGIGQKTIENILDLAKEHGLTMYQVIKEGLYAKNKDTFTAFVKMIERFREKLHDNDLESLLKAVLDDTGYRDYLTNDNEFERLENVKALVDDIKNYQETFPDSNLDEYLQMISLYTDKDSENLTDAVNLMTIHSSKGLEFDTVFVIGMSESVFPSDKSLADGLKGLEEERRLAYVAYTRAKRLLYLTESHDFSFVLSKIKTTSRFIEEIEDNYIDHADRHEQIIPTIRNTEAQSREKPGKTVKYQKGDRVVHTVFKEGIVVKVDGNFIDVAFAFPHGVKKILGSHPSIKKMEDQ